MLPKNSLSFCVIGFAGWLVLHTVLFAQVFKPEAVFSACFLGLSFLITCRRSVCEVIRAAKAISWIVVVMALWGGLQHWLDLGVVHAEGGRAHAWFDSPNTLATLINMSLIPVVVHYSITGKRSVLLLGALLFLGLVATQSRGGWLACGIGLLVSAILWRRARFVKSLPRAVARPPIWPATSCNQ